MVFEQALADAAAAWPALPAPDEAFVAFARDRVNDDGELAYPADLLVAYHAGRGEPVAFERVRSLLDALRMQLRSTGADAGMIDEVVSELPTDLVTSTGGAPPRIYGYAGRGPLSAWLRVIAVRALIKRRRRHVRSDGDDAIVDLVSPELGQELGLLRQQYGTEFRGAFAATIDELEPLQRMLLRQHHIDGLGLEQLGRLHGISRATVVRRLADARNTIFSQVRRKLLSELRVTGATVDSIIRLVRGEIDLSLERYL